MKKSLPYLLLVFLLMLAACESTPKRNGSSIFEHEDEDLPTSEEVIYDSIAKQEHIQKESAVHCDNLTNLTTKLKEVNSPDALILAKKEYTTTITSVNNALANLGNNEKAVIANYRKEAQEAYDEACRQYEIPASGVIANLQNLISRIDQIKTKQEFYRFQDCRLGMLRGLDDSHLRVDHKSKQIPEVKRLAQSLKSKYEAKRVELGLN